MPARKAKSRPPLTYEAVSPTARLNSVVKNAFNFARDVSDLYANTSISGLKKRSRTQPADQQAMLMGDINVVGPRPAAAVQSADFTEKVGGPRAAIALNSKAKLSSFRYGNQTGGISLVAAGGATLSQVGVTTAINVAAFTLKAGDLVISYSSGSVDPGSFNTWLIFFDDPDFLGGAVTYKATLTASDLAATLNRVYVGPITTTGAGGGSGGGDGTGGGGGGHWR